MATLQIHLLNNFQLVCNGVAVTAINQARMQALLAYLLLHRQGGLPRQQLAFLFWPDTSERQAHTNLRQLLHHLRRAWPALDDFVQIEARSLQWKPSSDCQVDLQQFEAAIAQATTAMQRQQWAAARTAFAAAVDLYAGDLLPACYEEWLLPERERLRQLFLQALEQLIVLCEGERNYPLAIRHAQRLLRVDPLHEPTYQRLMHLHALNGDRASALRTYHTCANLLARELGVDPHADTQTAYARLLKLDPTLEAANVLRAASADRLIGRYAAWEKLQAAWSRGASGHPHFVCISGEAGIGKTRLAEALLTWADRQGIPIARTRSYAAEGELAYAPIIEWLRAAVFLPARKELAAVWLSEVARLLPEILLERPDLPRPEPLSERWQRQRLFEALARAVLAVKQPLLLAIDDLQWADAETLEWLHYLLRFDTNAHLLIVGTVRTEEVDEQHALTNLLRQLRRSGQVTEFELERLDETETAALATQVAGQPLDVQRTKQIYQQSAGNPLFVVEMVRAASSSDAESVCAVVPFDAGTATPLPPKVQAVLQARLSQLSPSARTLAHLAAVIGRAFTFAELAQAGDRDIETVVQALDELWQRRIVREHGSNAYDFSHDLIRDVAYAEISPARQRQLHRQIAVALEQIHGSALDTVSAALAFHYEQAGLLEQALTYYQRAAQAAELLLAYSEASLGLQHGLALLKLRPATLKTKAQELDILIALGHLLRTTKGFAAREVGETYNQALELCQQSGTKSQIYRVTFGLCMYHLNRSEFTLARRLAENNLLITQELQDQEKRQYAYESLGLVQMTTAEFAAALNQFKLALAIPVRHHMRGNQREVEVENALLPVVSGLCLWLLGYPDQACQFMHQTLTILQRHPDPIHIVGDLEFVLKVQHFLHDMQEVYLQSQAIVTLATQYNIPMFQAIGMIYSGFARSHQGEISAGIAQLRHGLDLVQQTDVILYIPFYLALLAEAYGFAEQNAEALTVLNDALALVHQTGETWWQADLLRQQGELLLATGAAASEVEECYQRALQVARQQAAKSLELRAAMSLARLWQSQGKYTEARALLEPIYNWFTEGFATVDLQAAQALLAELTQLPCTENLLTLLE